MSPTTTQPRFTVEQTTDGVDLTSGDDTRIVQGEYDEPGIDPDQVPRANLTARNESGVPGHILAEGKEVMIRRHREDAFPGIVDEWTGTQAEQTRAQVGLMHKGYHLLRQSRCDPYTFDEDGDQETTRDAVTVNAWNPFIFREHGGTLDEHGEPNAVHGLRPDQLLKHAIGTQFAIQLDLRDNRWFLHSQTTASDAGLNVYQDEDTGDGRAKLQRVRNAGDGFAAGDNLETIPLNNGAPERGDMGTVSKVTVILIGERNGTQDPSVKACRDARSSSRTYSSVSLSRTDSFNGSSLSKWEGTVDLSGDGASDKDDIGLEVTIPGTSGDSDTIKLHYAAVLATTDSDTGVTEGTIETYDNPVDFTAGDEDWVERDYLGMTRLEMVQTIHKATEADPNTSDSPHWDVWVDADLSLHFEHRRGSDIQRTYTPGTNLTNVEHERYAGQLAFRAWGVGAGKSREQVRTADSLSDKDFSNGGLKIPANDPDGTAEYNEAPREVTWENPGQENPGQLLRETRAYLRIHSEPRKSWRFSTKVEGPRFFEPGDGVPVDAPKVRTNGTVRVVEVKRSWDEATPEQVDVQLGQSRDQLTESFVAHVQRNAREAANRPQPGAGTTGLSGPGIHFDKDHYGVMPFTIEDGQSIERVLLEMTTAPYESPSKASDGSSISEILNAANIRNIWAENTERGVSFDPYTLIEEVNPAQEGTYQGGTATATFVQTLAATMGYEVQLTGRDSTGGVAANVDVVKSITLSEDTDGSSNQAVAHIVDSDWGVGYNGVSVKTTLSNDSSDDLVMQGDLSLALTIDLESRSTSSTNHILHGESGSGGDFLSLQIDTSGKIVVEWDTSSGTETFTGSTTLSEGARHRIWVKRDTSNKSIKVSVNGTLEIDATYSDDTDAGSSITEFVLGHTNASPNTDGGITYDLWMLRGWDGTLVSDSTLDSIVDETDGSFSTYQNTLKGDETYAFFCEGEFVDGQEILQTDLNVSVSSDDVVNVNGQFTASDVPETGTVKAFVAGQQKFSKSSSGGDRLGSATTILGSNGLIIQTSSTHSHGLDFGIYQYDGDSGDGTGSPVYARDLTWGVDVDTGSDGIPNDWTNDQHPLTWGTPGSPQTVRVDITGWLTQDTNGVVKNGVHHVYFQGSADAANDNPTGLGRVRVTPVIIRKERERS